MQAQLFAHDQKPALLSWPFPIPCDTQALGCHIPKPREGGDKAYGRRNSCSHTKNLKSSMKEGAPIAGSSSGTDWQIPQYLHCSNVQWAIAAGITKKLYFKTFFVHPQNLNSQRQLHLAGQTGTQPRSAGAYHTLTRTATSGKVHLTGREWIFIYLQG